MIKLLTTSDKEKMLKSSWGWVEGGDTLPTEGQR